MMVFFLSVKDLDSSNGLSALVSVVGEDPPAMERFIIDFDAYTKSIILEAEDSVANHQRTVNDCITLRVSDETPAEQNPLSHSLHLD